MPNDSSTTQRLRPGRGRRGRHRAGRAWRAARAGLSVMVLERDEPGAGASGVAAGMLAPVTEADFGEQRAAAPQPRGPRAVARLRRRAGGGDGAADRLRRDRRAWSWPPTATTPRSCAACTPSSESSGCRPTGSPRARRASSSPGCRRASAARSSPPRTAACARATWSRRWPRRCSSDGGEMASGERGDGARDRGRPRHRRRGERRVEIVAADTVVIAAGAWSGVWRRDRGRPPMSARSRASCSSCAVRHGAPRARRSA